MRILRFAGVGFGILWLLMFTIFSFGSNSANGLVLYVLLAVSLVLIRSCVNRWEDGAPVVAALAFGAALYFGPIGGVIVALIATLAQNIDARGRTAGRRLVVRVVSVPVAALAAGFAFQWASTIAPFHLPMQAASIALSAIPYYAVLIIANLFGGSRQVPGSEAGRGRVELIPPTELAVGMALAGTVRFVYALCPSEPILLAMPVIYLAKQLLEEFLHSMRMSPSGDGQVELSDVYVRIIRALVGAIDARDRFARMHTSNVSKLALSIGRKLELEEAEMEALGMAALFHDVGKLWVPEHILLRPGKLDPEQFAKVQYHPALAEKILERVDFPWPISPIIRGHHEWWDGTGYPDGLKGEQIPLGARILCLADVFEAMTSKRLYRARNSLRETLKYIRGAAGRHFDPAVVQAFEKALADGDLPGRQKVTLDATAQPLQASDKAGVAAEDISRTSSEFVAIFEIAQTASNSLDLQKVLGLLAVKINSMISCSTCVIFLRNEESDILEAKIALGMNAQYFESAQATIGRGVTGMVARSGEGIIGEYDTHDLALPYLREPRAKLSDWVEPWSMMVVPIRTADGVLGTINLYHTKDGAFSEEDLHLLTAVSPQVGKAIENALLFKVTTESALTDPITGLHNARYMFVHLQDELTRAERLNRPLSVLCIDLDEFKAINDSLGHQKGDEVLREVGQLFCSQARDSDLVCRYAGDEFVILLPDTDRMGALMTKRRIEVLVDNLQPYGSEDQQVRLGVSIGVATLGEDGRDMHSLIAQADMNMYAAKKLRKEGAAA